MAVKFCANPTYTVEFPGVMEMLTRVTTGGVHASVLVPKILVAGSVAVMIEEPVVRQFPDSVAVSGPTVATEGVPLVQPTCEVMF